MLLQEGLLQNTAWVVSSSREPNALLVSSLNSGRSTYHSMDDGIWVHTTNVPFENDRIWAYPPEEVLEMQGNAVPEPYLDAERSWRQRPDKVELVQRSDTQAAPALQSEQRMWRHTDQHKMMIQDKGDEEPYTTMDRTWRFPAFYRDTIPANANKKIWRRDANWRSAQPPPVDLTWA